MYKLFAVLTLLGYLMNHNVEGISDDCFDKLNNKTYKIDVSNELCCNGKVFDNSNDDYLCEKSKLQNRLFLPNEDVKCNSTIYKSIDKACCGDHPFPRNDSLQCCGEHYIDPSTDTCCSEQVVHGVGECCGRNTIFNSLEEACFGGKLYTIPEGHDAQLYDICQLTDGTIGLYYAKTHMCCNGEVMSKSGNLRCHGNVQYDITTDIVVHGVGGLRAVQIEDGRTSRCGLEMLNPNREVCCNGQVHDVGSADGACCNHKPYSRHNASCCRDVITEGVPEIAGIQECSEEQSYWNSASISCQLGIVLDSYAEVQCCGNEVLSITEEICCAGKILTRIGQDDICCGTEILKPNAFCVEGRIVLKETHEDSYCLMRNDTFRIERIITYDSNAYICKDGALAVKKPNQRYCEGAKTIYDIQTEICCGHIRVHKNTNPWGLERRCCGYGVYHPQEQSCYGYHVFQIPERFAEICSLSLYDSRTEVCINDHIYSRTTTELTVEMCRKSNNLAAAFDQHCCQGKPISDRTHICCDDHVYSIVGMENPQCCGRRVVDLNATEAICCEESWHFTGGEAKSCIGAVAVAKRERLCGDTIYQRADGQCCGNGIYNPRTHLCCDGVRLPKSQRDDVCCGTTKYCRRNRQLRCCQGTLHKMVSGRVCCGSSLINPTLDVCLEDHYQVSGEQLEKTCDATDLDNPLGTCCGGILHFGKFGSCDGFRFVEPHSASSREVRADEDDLDVVDGENLYAHVTCGDALYNPLTHSCCDATLVENGRQVCCNDRVQNVTRENENSCCGVEAYNNSTAICCGGEKIKQLRDIRNVRDAKGCCQDGQYFDLETLQCQEGELQQEVEECSLCQDASLSKGDITDLAIQSVHHFNVRITRTFPGQNKFGVRVSPLFKSCPDCPAVLSRKELKKIKMMVLPENCDCEKFQRKGKYVLLTSGSLKDDGHFQLQSDDVLLPTKNAKIVRQIFET